MKFKTGEALLAQCEKEQITISEAMIQRELSISESTREEIFARMARAYSIMNDAVVLCREAFDAFRIHAVANGAEPILLGALDPSGIALV